jgi:hypothetical protein
MKKILKFIGIWILVILGVLLIGYTIHSFATAYPIVYIISVLTMFILGVSAMIWSSLD